MMTRLARADAAQDVAHGVDADFVEAHLLHLLSDALNDRTFVGALPGNGDQVAQKANHICFQRIGSGS